MDKDKISLFVAKEKFSFDDFLLIMEMLRTQCPWDREQTHESLKRYMIEEAYEVLEAIDKNDSASMCEELGDLLLQIVFHASIAAAGGREREHISGSGSEAGATKTERMSGSGGATETEYISEREAGKYNRFDMSDVITGVSRKMISRHPHIFGEVIVNSANEVLENWEQIKRKEKGISDATTLLKNVPQNLPSLMRAYKVQQKAAEVGFDWDDIGAVFEKVSEESHELAEAWASGDRGAILNEIGDNFFALVNLARFMDVQPELATTASTEKFIQRFAIMESLIEDDGKAMKGMNLNEMDKYWELAKKRLM
ncbi:MAG: nucleoside triphosphate pyrophosphohydrolase [Oscillospiraceae bacterium]|nr:nucleoside triphosphate pyrophosphohydrolase [Oscillospiraceae bacterium]